MNTFIAVIVVVYLSTFYCQHVLNDVFYVNYDDQKSHWCITTKNTSVQSVQQQNIKATH